MTDIRILIVEDDLSTARNLADRLNELGYTVCGIAHSGREAIQLANDVKPDLVFMKLRLPGDLNGLQAAEEITSRNVIPVIYTKNDQDLEALKSVPISKLNGIIIDPGATANLNNILELILQNNALAKELHHYHHQLEASIEERSAELALKDSERRFREMLANVKLIAVILDVHGNITFCSDFLLKLTNWKREEILGQNWFEIFLPGNQEAWRRFQENMSGSEIQSYTEDTIYTRSGEERLISWSNTIRRDSKGKILGTTIIGEDITERRQAEAALLESENRYRQVVELSPILIAVQKPHKVTYINPAGAKLLGGEDPQEFIGHSLLEYVQRDERQDLYEKFFRLAELGEELPLIEQTIVRPDGTQVELEVSATVTRQHNETTLQVIGWDITERKQIQENLSRQAALADIELAINQPRELQNVLEQIAQITTQLLPASGGTSVALWDHNSNDFWIGSSTMPEPMKSMIDRFVRKPDGPSHWILTNKKLIVTPDASTDPFGPSITLTRHGYRAYVGVPLMVEEEVLGVLYVFDRHIRNYTQQDLDFLAGLANRAALAIAKVRLYDSLNQARASAEETARTKDQFLANMSHELRTPLTAVVSFSELLQETELDHQQEDLVHTIHASADKLLSLINDILDFSRLEAEKLLIDIQPFDLRACIEDVLDLVTLETRRKGLELAYQIDQGVPNQLLGDAKRLGQVLTNLVNNAVKFSEEGEIILSVRLWPPTAEFMDFHQASRKHVELLFAIRDTGIGIPPDKIDTLFTPFKQIDASTTRKYGGSGLGLAISKQLVQLMGGEIWVKSSGVSGEGATFYFTVKLQSSTAPLAPYLQKNPSQLTGKRVFLLSKSKIQRQVTTDLMEYWGLKPFAFETEDSAYSWLEQDHPLDLVVLHLSTAHVSHLTMVEKIYKKRDPAKIPLVIITSVEEIPEFIWPVEVSGWLKTPIKPARLFELLMGIYSQPIEERQAPETSLSSTIVHPLSVLIVEDDPTNRKALTMLLGHLGYRHDVASNGLEAIAALEHGAFEVVVMDLQMPEMDGLSATHYIRSELPEYNQPFIIALTADARQEARNAMLEAGVDYFLTKPVHGDAMVKALEQASERLTTGHLVQLPPSEPASVDRTEEMIDDSVLEDFIRLMGEQASKALQELIGSFTENTPELVETLKTASAQRQWSQVKWAAHTLKGNSELVGGTHLAGLCKQLETMIADGEVEMVADYVNRIEVEFEVVKSSLLKKLEQN